MSMKIIMTKHRSHTPADTAQNLAVADLRKALAVLSSVVQVQQEGATITIGAMDNLPEEIRLSIEQDIAEVCKEVNKEMAKNKKEPA